VQARLWRAPLHPSLTQRDLGEDADPDVAARSRLMRALVTLCHGDPAGAGALAAAVQPQGSATRLLLAAIQALRHLVDGHPAQALAAARDAQAIGAAEAVHLHDTVLHLLCAAAAIDLGDSATAQSELDTVEATTQRRGDRAWLHLLRATLAGREGKAGSAARELRNAALLAGEAGLPGLECRARLALAQSLAAAADLPGADAQWRSADALATRLGSPLLRVLSLLTQAALSLQAGDEAGATAPLGAGLTLARDLGLPYLPGATSALLGPLCVLALRRGIVTGQARALIAAHQLAPPPEALQVRTWPWACQITTLGGFDLRRQGDPIEFSAKGPGRPVELLKVLISLGAQQVRVEQLADALWPRVDADYAHKSFTATLHRLRRILGQDDALRLSDGRLSLNPVLCWVDTRALDDLLTELDTHLREPHSPVDDAALQALVDDVLALYQGPYLGDDSDHPSHGARREQLRARLLRMMPRMAKRWEDSQRPDAVVDLFQRLIDADELCEGFYRHLIVCQQRRGDTTEAVSTYERLQSVLAHRLQQVPSPHTRQLFDGPRG
jgi:DNA-binding SARP family transcriptional activator